MRSLLSLGVAALAALLLAACSDGTGGSSAAVDTSGARGSLVYNPPLRIATLTAADFTAQLNAQGLTGQQLLALVSGGTGILPCGVDFHYIQYGTVDGGNPQQPTTASGALMVPTGGAGCSGARPIVLYAHGTAVDRNTNLADVTNPNNTEGALIAATFAAFGYIVVAPNLAGYDSSPLPYHPFLNGDQNSKEMIDALTAARKALGNIPAAGTTDSGKLFVAGYSEGGYVAMAAQKAMQAFSLANPGNTSLQVTAAGASSGPYALSSFGDAVFFGNVNLGGTAFGPMIATSYQHAFGNIFAAPTDIAEAPYAANVGVLPSPTPINTLFAQGVLPQLFFFNHNPPTAGDIPAGTPAPIVTALTALFPTITPPAAQFAFGFNPSPNFPTETNLIKNTFRAAYLADALLNPDGVVPAPTTGLPPAATGTTLGGTLRGAFKANDMRSWVPTSPVLLCGGHQDPTVFYQVNTQTMQAFWTPQLLSPALLTVVDVDPAPATTAPAGTPQAVFLAGQSAVFNAAGGGAAGTQAVLQAYHGTLVPPPCTVTVRGFFNTF
jgi:prolyl oligopeptidase family protein